MRSSALEDAFLRHPWREMHSTSTYPLLSCQLFLCDLMTFFSVIFGFLFSFSVYIYYIFLVCGYHEVFNIAVYIYDKVSDFLILNAF